MDGHRVKYGPGALMHPDITANENIRQQKICR